MFGEKRNKLNLFLTNPTQVQKIYTKGTNFTEYILLQENCYLHDGPKINIYLIM